MITAKVTLVMMLAYILALAAGTTSGLLAERWRATPAAAAKAPLADQLQLTPVQAAQMRQIWEKTSVDLDSFLRRAQDIQRQRDQALVELLTDDQKEKFAIMDKEYAQRFAALKDERQGVFQQALTDTEAMLNDWQRAKYERIVQDRIGSDAPVQRVPATEPSVNELRP